MTQKAQDLLPDSTIPWRDLQQHAAIRQTIAEVIPGLAELADIDQSKQEFDVGARIFHQPKFPTATGKANIITVPLPPVETLQPNQLRLMTVRSEGQFNTVVYEEVDLYRQQDRRNVIMMNPQSRMALGLQCDEVVTVRSTTGALSNILVREIDIPVGNAVMYFPEANRLVPRRHDAASKTPAFKHVVVEVVRRP